MAIKKETSEEKQGTENPKTEEKSEETKVKEPEQKTLEEEFRPKYSQFWDGDKESYYKKLETLYGESSKEGVRLANELSEREKEMEVVKKLVQSDPAIKQKLADNLYDGGYKEDVFDDDGKLNKAALAEVVGQVIDERIPKHLQQNPVLKNIEQDKQAKDREVFTKFEKEHPELMTDPSLQQELEVTFGALASASTQKGKSFDFEKTLNKAWKVVAVDRGIETKKESSDEELEGMKKMVQKQDASMEQTSSSSGTKTGGKSLTPQEQSIAKKLGLTDEEYLDGKKLSEEAKTI